MTYRRPLSGLSQWPEMVNSVLRVRGEVV